MTSQASFGSSFLFQTINDDLSASMATADQLSREFDSLMKECSPSTDTTPQQLYNAQGQKTSIPSSSSLPSSSNTNGSGGSSLRSSSQSSIFEPSPRIVESLISSNKNRPSSPGLPKSSQVFSQLARPDQSPHTTRRLSPTPIMPVSYDRSPRSSLSYMDHNPSPSAQMYNQPSRMMLHPSSNTMSQYDPMVSGRQSPRLDRMERSSSPRPFSQPEASTLPRNFMPFRQTDEVVPRQKSPAKWNETDLDVSYERKPHHTYDKTEWQRPSVPNRNWTESNLDGPPPTPTPKKDPATRPLQLPQGGSLPRNTRISVPPDCISSPTSLYSTQPIISRISIPPSSTRARQHRSIPLSVIMRLQNPHYASAATHYPRGPNLEGIPPQYRQQIPFPTEYLPQPPQPELRQPAYFEEALNSGDVDAELERLDPAAKVSQPAPEGPVPSKEMEAVPAGEPGAVLRPLSPTRLQPVVSPQTVEVPVEEILMLRSEIPRALKRRGSVDQSQAMKQASSIPPSQYKQFINKWFHRNRKTEKGGDSPSSSDSEESPTIIIPKITPVVPSSLPAENKGLKSILRRNSRERKGSSSRARLSPLVLLLDGALVGELETVQKAVQEMTDPSQPNDEGITALHNAICGGHHAVVELLVQIGANVSAPDSHGWTPLHCAASCNDLSLCEYLVRSGAAVMAVTESDGATAAQKCDPYAPGYEECESFLRGVEEAMGVEKSGVLYALWGYPAQAPDELSFREGDMVTILKKPEAVDWWWASLCGREGLVPNNYFGLFPKVRPKSLC
ncbi:relA-associated inhibitor [Denticeps clupeoides]|uniref:SH3 domain-containing protein n=1 Tax=Denticeps clupeoides TaxID=299321 RepID=A0AAY4DD19_9TELE|nr:relA-associated inhibitor [Denticeps clupeoides]XP_028818462.1 relA-associated inhibitor [Denticeps clupeoides]